MGSLTDFGKILIGKIFSISFCKLEKLDKLRKGELCFKFPIQIGRVCPSWGKFSRKVKKDKKAIFSKNGGESLTNGGNPEAGGVILEKKTQRALPEEKLKREKI